MNGVFGSGLSFWQLIFIMLTFVVSFVAIRISLKFDVNKYLDSRKSSYTQKLINACTHVQIKHLSGDKFEGRSMYISPPGTIQWQCQRCGHVTHRQGDEFERELEYYMSNIEEYKMKNDRFIKLLKKSGQI